MKKICLLLLLGVIFFGCVTEKIEAIHDHLCPDGTFVQEESLCPEFAPPNTDLSPDDYPSVTLEEGKMNYVKADGQITINVELENEGKNTLWIVPSRGASGYGTYPIVTDNDNWHITVIETENNTYLINFTESKSGEYKISITKESESGNIAIASYSLIVIGRVNESQAYQIGEEFMFEELIRRDVEEPPGHYSCGVGINFNVIQKEIKELPAVYDVFIKAGYTRCLDLGTVYDILSPDLTDRSEAANNTLTGHYMIDKKTGLIIG